MQHLFFTHKKRVQPFQSFKFRHFKKAHFLIFSLLYNFAVSQTETSTRVYTFDQLLPPSSLLWPLALLSDSPGGELCWLCVSLPLFILSVFPVSCHGTKSRAKHMYLKCFVRDIALRYNINWSLLSPDLCLPSDQPEIGHVHQTAKDHTFHTKQSLFSDIAQY